MPTPSTREIRIEFDQRVPMRDGITLSADIYRPIDSSDKSITYPVILTRTPYMKLSERMLVPAKYFAERGYVFVAMVYSCRILTKDKMAMMPSSGALPSPGPMATLAL